MGGAKEAGSLASLESDTHQSQRGKKMGFAKGSTHPTSCPASKAIPISRSLRNGFREGLKPSYGLASFLRRDWRQFKDTAVLCGFGDFTSSQCQPNGVELHCIFQRKIRRPPGIILDQFDGDFSRVTAFMNEFHGFSNHRIFRIVK